MDIRKHLSRIGWAYTVFLVVSMAAQAAVTVIMSTFWRVLPAWMTGENVLLLISQIVMYGLGFPIFWILMSRIPAWQMTDQKKMRISDFLIAVVICFGATYIGNIIGEILMAITGEFTGNGSTNPLFDVLGEMNLGMVAVTTVAIAPVMEELMFRKFLIDRLVPLGQRTAVVISGISFGLFHGNFYQFFYAAILGMIFAYLYSYTGKIRYNIMLHMLINMVGGVAALSLSRGSMKGDPLAIIGMALLGMFMIVTMFVSAVLVLVNLRKIKWFAAWEHSERGIAAELVMAPGVWGFLAVSLVLFLMG